MKHTHFFQLIATALVLIGLSSCGLHREDAGPLRDSRQTYSLTDFDRLDMGSAFIITVQPGAAFSIVAEGDQRNLDDLQVYTRNGTLFAKYRNSRSRQYETSFTITMPTLRGAAFSGASRSNVTGFTNLSTMDIELSGASKGQFAVQATRATLTLSGASNLQLTGVGTSLAATVSGASILQGFDYPVGTATLDVSGASKARVSVATSLAVEASGASNIRYRGTPTVRQQVSGASSVQGD
ncbi:GIN domain-containing protein [Spirosoma areae]